MPGATAKPAVAAKATQEKAPPTPRAITIFAHFPSEAATQPNVPAWARSLFDPELAGSLTHFYATMSFGQHWLSGEVASRRYASLQEASAYLALDPQEVGQYGRFVLEVLRQADADLDFARFDNDGPDGLANSGDDDGVVDVVFINTLSAPRGFLFRGATGFAALGFEDHFVTDDRGVNGQAIRIDPSRGTVQQTRTFAEAVGVMAHEYGHLLGLPDLFNTDFTRRDGASPTEDSAGIGHWGLMGWGATGWHGDDGPNSFCAWSRLQLGWAQVTVTSAIEERLDLPQVGQSGAVYQIPLGGDEFFLLEYRRRSSSYYDRALPAEGVLIWHAGYESRDLPRFVVDLECADGRWTDAGFPLGRQAAPSGGEDNLDFWAHDQRYAAAHQGNRGDGTDPFDGATFTAFTPGTNPTSHTYRGEAFVYIEDIRLEGDRATGRIKTRGPQISLDIVKVLDDQGDGTLVAGEEARIQLLLSNRGSLPAQSLRVQMTTADPDIEILQDEVSYPALPAGRHTSATLDRSGLPRLRLDPSFTDNKEIELNLAVFVDGALALNHPFVVRALSSVRLSGIITDLAGAPAAGISLFFLRTRPSSAVFETTTNADGSFQLVVTPGFYSASINQNLEQGLGFERQQLELFQDSRFDLALTPLHAVSGFVRDPEGNPLEGFNLVAGEDRTTSAADGSYTIRVKQGYSRIGINRASAGFEERFPQQNIHLQVDGPLRYDIELRPGVSVEIHLVDPQGQAIPSTLTKMSSAAGAGGKRTDEQGRAQLSLVPGIYTFNPFALHSPFVEPFYIHPIAIVADTAFQVTIPHGHTITGRVVDLSPQPFFNGELTFFLPKSTRSVFLNADQDFRLLLPPGPAQVVYTLLGTEGSPTQALGQFNINAEQDLTLALKPGTRLSGRLLGPGNRPLAGALVLAQAATQEGRALTSAEGVFELFLDPGPYELVVVEAETHYRSLGRHVLDPLAPRTYQMASTTSLSGQLVDASGEPTEGIVALSKGPDALFALGASQIDPASNTSVLNLYQSGPPVEALAQVDATGRFELETAPGVYELVALPPAGVGFGRLYPDIPVDEPVVLNPILPDPQALERYPVFGAIADEADQPYTSLILHFYDPDTNLLVRGVSQILTRSYEVALPVGRYLVGAGVLGPLGGFRRHFDLGTLSVEGQRRWDIDLTQAVTAITEPRQTEPAQFKLQQNWPNPFNPSTTISFWLATASAVELNIYDILGQKVRLLADGVHPAGAHSVRWDGRDQSGKGVASGVYLYRIITHRGRFTQTKKMVLVR